MNFLATGMVSAMASFTLAVLSVSLLIALFRLIRGPSLPDRVVALDLMAAISVGMMAAYSILTQESAILDVAVVVALITFLSTIAFAAFLEQGARR
jgi:multicomponent Na+:H+ antiporter subunit F